MCRSWECLQGPGHPGGYGFTRLLHGEDDDGDVVGATGFTGEGHEAFAQLLSAKLGIPHDRFVLKQDDSDVITFGTGAHAQLAHLSSAEGIVLAERIAGKNPTPIDYDQVPGCTYCDPEIGSIGLTEAEAKKRGFDVVVGQFPFGVLGRAKIAGEIEGFVKIVAEKKYDEILGVHILGNEAPELIAEYVLAMNMEGTAEEVHRAIHAHPTLSEALMEAAAATAGEAIHI